MTFAEWILLLAFGALIYRFLRPLQRRLEAWFTRKLSGGGKGSKKPVIDITDYQKK